jgi:hypothetical protein
MRIVFAALLLALLASCGSIQQQEIANRPTGAETFASVGDIMLHVDVTENLPNVFGDADIWGRKRNRGFSEIRYMGLTPQGVAIFQRRDVDIVTNEDTMNRMGFGTATVTAQPAGGGVIASGVVTQAPPPNVNVLPPDTTQFTLDLSQGHVITLRGKTIDILKVTPSGVSFMVQ